MFGLLKEFDTKRISGILIIQVAQGICNTLIEYKKADQDHGKKADNGKNSHQQLVSVTLFKEDQTRRQADSQAEHTGEKGQGNTDLEVQHLASVLIDLIAAILEPGPDHQRDQNDAEHAAQMQGSHH